jgi:uncharacterized protein (TIGR02246 family)
MPLPLEDTAIQHRHDEWAAAWNKHDPKLMAARVVADGDLINPFGRHARGTAAIEMLFAEEQTGPMDGTSYAGTIENIHYLGDTASIVDVAGGISGMKGPDGAALPPFKPRVTWITEKKAEKWMATGAPAFATLLAPMPAK